MGVSLNLREESMSRIFEIRMLGGKLRFKKEKE
jgi:hypothetical protein